MQRDADGRAMAWQTIHLTLAFLGEAEPQRAIAAARGARGEALAFPAEAAGYWRHNRIVWAGPAAVPAALESLVASLHGSLRAAGFELEKRPFAAHVTLVRRASRPAAFPPLPRIDWPAQEFVLVRSRPGSRYEIVERFALH